MFYFYYYRAPLQKFMKQNQKKKKKFTGISVSQNHKKKNFFSFNLQWYNVSFVYKKDRIKIKTRYLME